MSTQELLIEEIEIHDASYYRRQAQEREQAVIRANAMAEMKAQEQAEDRRLTQYLIPIFS